MRADMWMPVGQSQYHAQPLYFPEDTDSLEISSQPRIYRCSI